MMKKLSTLFSLLLLFASCNKEIEPIQQGESESSELVRFSASMLSLSESKSAEPKTEWRDGDQVAIFVESDKTKSYCYDIDQAGQLSPADGVEPFKIMDTDQTQTTYLAFYPYNAALSSVEEYESASSKEIDFMSSIASGDDTIEFTFSHLASLLYFDLAVEGTIVEASVIFGDTTYILDFVQDGTAATTYIFMEPTSNIEDAILKLNVDNITKYYSLSEEFTQWEAGHIYTYKSIDTETQNL